MQISFVFILNIWKNFLTCLIPIQLYNFAFLHSISPTRENIKRYHVSTSNLSLIFQINFMEMQIFDTGSPHSELVTSSIYTKFHFLCLDNKQINLAYWELVKCCCNTSYSKTDIFEQLDKSVWYKYVTKFLEISASMLNFFKDGYPVVIQSSGPDGRYSHYDKKRYFLYNITKLKF